MNDTRVILSLFMGTDQQNHYKTLIFILVLILTCLLLISCNIFQQQTGPSFKEKQSSTAPVKLLNIPYDALKPELVVQLAHAQPITAMSLSGNGQFLATASWDRTIRLWSLTTGKQIRQLRKKNNNEWILTFSLALSYDGERLLSGGDDNNIYLWSTDTGQVISQYSGHKERVTSIVYSPDEKHFISGSRDKSISYWSLSKRDTTKTQDTTKTRDTTKIPVPIVTPDINIATLPGEIVAMQFTPGGKSILAASYDSAWLIDIRQKSIPEMFIQHPAGITALAISDDGEHVLTGDLANNIWLSDFKKRKKIKSFSGHGDQIFSLDFSPDGQKFVSSSQDNSIRFWNIDKTKAIKQIDLKKGDFVRQVHYVNRDNIVYSKGAQLLLYNRQIDKEMVKFVKNVGWASSVSVSKNGFYLLIGSWDNTAYLWDLRSGMVAHYLIGHHNHVRAVAFSANNQMAVTADRDGKAILWDVKTGHIIKEIHRSDKGIKTVAFSPDNSTIVLGDDEGVLWLESVVKAHNSSQSSPFWQARHPHRIHTAMFSPGGQYILSSSHSELFLWDSQNGKLIHTYKEHSAPIHAIDFSPDGRFFASSGTDKQIIIHDLQSGKVKAKWDNKGGVIYALKYSPDGQYLAFAGADELIQLWDIHLNKIINTFKGSTGIIIDLAFSADGNYLFSSGANQMTQLWQIVSGNNLAAVIGFNNGTWAVVDQQGRYDASNGGKISGLHWVIGKETIQLSQLKQRYYEPGLLSKVLGYNLEPVRNIEAFSHPKLYPKITSSWDPKNTSVLNLRLEEQGGGIGKVVILINGKEVVADARGYANTTSSGTMNINFDIDDHPFLIPGEENMVEVYAYNNENYLSSRGVQQVFTAPAIKQNMQPTLWAIIAGISDYQGQRIDLHYAAKDAVDIETALTIGAEKLFGPDRVNVKLITTANGKDAIWPDKPAFTQAFQQLMDAKPWDILVIYLAGHGLSIKDEYYYLTAEAGTIDLSDPAIVKHLMISGSELTQWLKRTPIQKQVMLLDTCAAGSIANSFSETREISSGQIRAIERMKDRTGLHVLMGSAANAVSYEATQFEQGLMTYALLQGIKGAALKDNELVDVSTLLQYVADTVPELAADIGGVQRPRIASPDFSESFSIGYLDKTAQALIPLKIRKPVLLKPVFINQETLLDTVNLTARLRNYFREQNYKKNKKEKFNSASINIAYLDIERFPAAIYVSGVYQIIANKMHVRYALGRDNSIMASSQIVIPVDKSETDNSDLLAEKLATEIYNAINKLERDSGIKAAI